MTQLPPEATMSANPFPCTTGCPARIAVGGGACTHGGADVPAMSDETMTVREQGAIFLGGRPLGEAGTCEVVDAETLGGADVHTSIAGVADHFAENDAH